MPSMYWPLVRFRGLLFAPLSIFILALVYVWITQVRTACYKNEYTLKINRVNILKTKNSQVGVFLCTFFLSHLNMFCNSYLQCKHFQNEQTMNVLLCMTYCKWQQTVCFKFFPKKIAHMNQMSSEFRMSVKIDFLIMMKLLRLWINGFFCLPFGLQLLK